MPESRDPQQLLEDAIRKRDELNTFIKVYQEMLGGTDTKATENGAPQKRSTDGAASDLADPLSVVFPGMFFGRSQPGAVRLFLEQMKPRPQKTKTILEALERGGVKVGGSKPMTNLWGILNRDKENFVNVPKAGWGLVEWYDAAVIAKMRREQDAGEEEKPEAGG